MRLIRVVRERITSDDVVRFRVELAGSARILDARVKETESVRSYDRQVVIQLGVVFDNDDDRSVEHEFILVRDGARFDLPVNNAVIHTGFTDDGFIVLYHLGPVANELRNDEAV